MRVESGDITRQLYFMAVDATDLKTFETGLATWTVYRTRNGAAEVAYTTPTIAEIDATNCPGLYAILLDEDTTIAAGVAEEQCALRITHAGMAPVTLVYTLFANLGVALYLTAQAGAASTITLAAAESSTDDFYNGDGILIVSGTGAGQYRQITDYVGSTRVATVDRAWATQPDSTSVYRRVYGSLGNTVAEVADAVLDEALSGHTTAGTAGKALADIETDATAILEDTGTTIPATLTTIDNEIGVIDPLVDAIKAKTDSLTFTTAGIVDANVQQINDVTITGDGSATPYNVV